MTTPSLPPKMSNRLQSITAQLTGVRTHVTPLLKLPVPSTLARLAPMERARLQVALGFAINALFFIYLKTKGENPLDHPVKQELDRVRAYLKKIKTVEAALKEKSRKKEVRARHDLKPDAAIAFVDTTVVKRTVERTLGIKRKKDTGEVVKKRQRTTKITKTKKGGNKR
jgi:hypothetical protein